MTCTLARLLVFLALLAPCCLASCAADGDACAALKNSCPATDGADGRAPDAPADARPDGAADGTLDTPGAEGGGDGPTELGPASDTGVPSWAVTACARIGAQCMGEPEPGSGTWNSVLQRFGAFGAQACERLISCQLANIVDLVSSGACVVAWEAFYTCIGDQVQRQGKPGCSMGCDSALQGIFTNCGCPSACGDCT